MNLPPSSWLEKPSSPSWSRRVPCRDQQQYRSPSCKPCCVKPSSLRVVRALARRSFSLTQLARSAEALPGSSSPQKPISFGQRVLFRSCGVHEFVLGRRRLRRLYTQNPHFTFIFRSSSSPPKRTVSLPKGALIGVAPRPIYYCGTTSRSTRPGNRDRPCWGESDRSGR